MTPRPWVVLVGGFLGAGKTTLLLSAAKELDRRGMRSALILNDQGDSLVDTEYAALSGIAHGEVTGGCFCCRFSELVDVIEKMREHAPDVIFAEPVGSCTDILATTLLALYEYSDVCRIAPYTVLVDPQRATALLRSDADPNLAFLFRKQIEEADLICFTKSDLNLEIPAIAAPSVRQTSAKTGQGVAAWLDEILSGRLTGDAEVLDIDYEQYATAEAALAWLNAQASIRCRIAISPAMLLGPFLSALDTDLTTAGVAIVHLKAIVQAGTGFVKAAICGNGEEPLVQGMLDASPAVTHELLLNLRAVGAAISVRTIVERNLAGLEGDVSDVRISCFHPAPPRPQRRIQATRSHGTLSLPAREDGPVILGFTESQK